MRRLAGGACLALALALGGCAPDPEGNATGVCTVMCRCLSGLPHQQRECVDACVDDPAIRQASNACVQCVFERANACTDLFQDCLIDGPCNRPTPDPGGDGTPDASIIVNAN
ncbi:MAG TPA: hypothetical protein VN253_06950 [Kofleriaceae bacterium]|nr:hypothetical protein [Kofleriaceae bacterium]